MRTMWAAVAVGLATVVAWAADDKPKPADRLAAVKKEATDAEESLYKEYDKLKDDKEAAKKANELFKAHEEGQAKRFAEALEIAKVDPKADVAFDALEWLLLQPQTYFKPAGKEAMQLVGEHHASSPKVGKIVVMLGRFGSQGGGEGAKAAEQFLKAVGEKNEDKSVRGQLAMVKAWQAKAKYDAASYRQQKDAEELATVAERAFEAAVKEFGEVKVAGRGEGQTIAAVAKVELFELQNLRVGKAAPDIEGEDLDGTKFKLSDYKGKVVVLDFWGDW